MSSTASVLLIGPNALEAAAIRLHDHMWKKMDVNMTGRLEVGGDDKAVKRLIRLLNELQDEIKSSGIPHREYGPNLDFKMTAMIDTIGAWHASFKRKKAASFRGAYQSKPTMVITRSEPYEGPLRDSDPRSLR